MQLHTALRQRWRLACAVILVFCLCPGWANAQALAFDIPAQDAAAAIQEFGRQAGVQILAPAEALQGVRTSAVVGTYDARAALQRLLEGTDLAVASDDGRTITLRKGSARAAPAPGPAPAPAAPPAPRAEEAPVPDSTIESVVVTATRRAEKITEIPMSLTAFTQQKLDEEGLHNMDDLSRLSPGVTLTRNGTAGVSNYNDEESDISIRGIDSNAGTSTTGIYVDDTPIQSRHMGFGTFNAFPALFDLQRVEVLRGPQGTLFGAGAEGGAVRFITPEPSLRQFSEYMRAEVAQTRNGAPSFEFGAAAGGPLANDSLGYRVSASYRRDGGYVDRVDYRTGQTVDADSNWEDTQTARLALKWAATGNFSATASLYYQRLYLNDTAAYWAELSDPSGSEFRNGNAQPNQSTDPLYIGSIRLNWDLGAVRLTNSTSYYARDQHGLSDYTQFDRTAYLLIPTYGPRPPAGDTGTAYFKDLQRDWYEELRAESGEAQSPLSWTAGIFLSRLAENSPEVVFDPTLNAEYNSYYTVNPDPYFAPPPFCTTIAPCPGGQISTTPRMEIVDRQVALYGEANLRLDKNWKLTAGARVARTSYSADGEGYGPFTGPAIGPSSPIVFSGSHSETPVTPKFVASYAPDPDRLAYASASKGFRVGGINQQLGSVCAYDLSTIGLTSMPESYQSDSLWSYELGGKFALDQRRLQVNASLFLVNWSNIQENVYLPTCGFTFVQNLGHVRSTGGDVQVQWRPAHSLLIEATVARALARYTETVCGAAGATCTGAGATTPPVVSAGDQLRGAPWTVIFSGEVHGEVRETQLYGRAGLQYTSPQTGLVPGQNPSDALSDSTIPRLPRTLNLSLRGGVRLDSLDVSAFVNNVTNDAPVLFAARDSLASSLYFNRSVRPRTIGLTATYTY